VRDPGFDANGHPSSGRGRERELGRIGAGRRGRDPLCNPFLGERRVVEHVPGTCAGLSCGRLDEIVLRPGDLALEELFAPLVVDARDAAVELRNRDELRLRKVDVRHVSPVELVHPRRQLCALRDCEAQPVADAPRIRAEAQRAAGTNVLLDERLVSLEAAGGQDRRLGRGLAEPHAAGRADEHLGKAPWIEAFADRAWIPGLVRDDGRAQRLDPGDALVELFPDRALQPLVPGRAFGPEVVPLTEPPDHAARQQHRTAGARPFLVDGRSGAELACARCRTQAGHARAGDD